MRIDLTLIGRVPREAAEEVLARLPPPWVAGKIVPSRLVPDDFLDPGRGQVDAGQLLEALPPSRAGVLVALTHQDLFLPVMAHVCGLAPLDGARAVVSIARLDPGAREGRRREKLLRRRMLVEVVHEAGHARGLVHCPVPACAMHASLTPELMDLKSPRYCPSCLAGLRPGEPQGSPRRSP
ncbi:MAG: hypothetical protein P1V51_02730 [Deltaproteobacteria bacterium]|nr:hypothetical protein [Deltaproteobacteria bacterium]